MINLTSCRPLGLRATASEAAELAETLQRHADTQPRWRLTYLDTREAAVCVEVLRRTYGERTG
jgi:hypothetical protein